MGGCAGVTGTVFYFEARLVTFLFWGPDKGHYWGLLVRSLPITLLGNDTGASLVTPFPFYEPFGVTILDL